MRYLIENETIYDTDSGEVCTTSSGLVTKKKLTNTANCILAVLVASHGKVVERKYLLENVWEEHGLSSSNASLNQYISILRKVLASFLGDVEVIITYPKVGFSLSSDIHIESIDDTKKHFLARGRKTYSNVMNTLNKKTLIVVFFLVALISGMVYFSSSSKEKNIKNYLGECQLFSNITITEKINNSVLSTLEKVHPDLLETCSNSKANLIVYFNESAIHGKKSGFFTSLCQVDSQTKKTNYCNSVYLYDWSLE